MATGIDRTLIERALSLAGDTRHVVVEGGALAGVDRLFRRAFGDREAIVVADETTFAVAGRTVYDRLAASGMVRPPVVFPAQPPLHADLRRVVDLEQVLAASNAIPVAVGAGTINDLAKLAAHRLGRPYMVVATAASMDGYAAFGAAITDRGFKQTFACAAPRVVLADVAVVAAAPPALTAAGYGDLLGKVTAGADWLVADALEVEPVQPRAWSIVQPILGEAVGEPARLAAGDRAAVERFFRALVLAGLAMQVAHGSRPASGAEHQLSHLWEMNGLSRNGVAPAHGVKVGLGTVAIAALYERLLAIDFTTLDVDARCAAWPSRDEVEREVRRAHSRPLLADRAVAESLAKHPTRDQLRRRLERLRERWPDLRERIAAQLVPAAVLRRMLAAAGCPTEPAELGLSAACLQASYAMARQIRRRYTVLDLAAEAGVLESCIEGLFRPLGFWGGLRVPGAWRTRRFRNPTA